jgi:hypothetical protein
VVDKVVDNSATNDLVDKEVVDNSEGIHLHSVLVWLLLEW